MDQCSWHDTPSALQAPHTDRPGARSNPRNQRPRRQQCSPTGGLGHQTPTSPAAPIRSLTAEFDPDKYQDDYRIQVLDLIGRKAAGEEFELPAVESEKPKIVDMMAALEAAKAARGRHPTAHQAPDAAKKPAKRAAKPQARKTA